MRLSSYEVDFFNKLKNARLSNRDRAEIRRRSPALADALAEYQQRKLPTQSPPADIKNILPELHPHQVRQQQRIEALHRQGYPFDLEGLKFNNPWVAHNVAAMLIIEQMRPDWAMVLNALAKQRQQSSSP
jgi:hypothetical protein